MEKVIKITNCLDCKYHKVIADPDPNDWFNDDDEAIVCTKVKNDRQDTASKWVADRQEFKVVSGSCRPYNLRKEGDIPKWCPL